MSDLVLDEATHTYRWKGDVVPGLTRMLSDMNNFQFVTPEHLAFKAELGKQVHLACHFEDTGGVKEESLDERVIPYVLAYRKFRKLHGSSIIMSEHPQYHHTLRFACTIDRVIRRNGRPMILELKTTAEHYPTAKLQTAGQVLAYNSNHLLPAEWALDRGSILLSDNGTFDLEMHTDQDDYAAFTACLTRYRWLLKHKLIKDTK